MSTAEIKKLGRFEILNEIGSGGMGVVYKGRDPKINRLLALKVIRTFFGASRKKDEIQALERFYLEAQAAGSLSHQNIVTIYDVGEDDTPDGNIVYIAMEFLDGKGLDHHIDNESFPSLREKINIVHQIAEGLDYAHKREVIHRDVKPGNIIITERNIPKLTDFGLARFSDASMTMSGTILGTPNYMSPEQVQGKKVDARSDFFALTVIFYEMLTGIKPFAGETITTVIYKVVNEEPEAPSLIDPSLPKAIDHFIKKGLAKSPEDRFQNGIEFVEALDQLLSGTFSTPKDTSFDPDATIIVNRSELSYKFESIYNRYRRKIFAGAAGALGLILATGLYLILGHGPDLPPKDTAKVGQKALTIGNLETGVPKTAKQKAALIMQKEAEAAKKEAEAAKKEAEAAKKEAEAVKAASGIEGKKSSKSAGTESKKTKKSPPPKPLPPQLITIRTDPSNAQVWIGNKFLGESPVNKYKHDSGRHTLLIKLAGHKTYKKTINIDKELDLTIKLEDDKVSGQSEPVSEKLADNVGGLIVKLPKKEGILLVVDGREYKSFSGNMLKLSQLSPGSHILYIQIPGMQIPYSNRIKIKGGGFLTIDCSSGKACK